MQTTRVSVFQGVMFVFSIMIVPSKAADPCDSGWFYMYNENEKAGKCYYVSNTERTFNSSASRCQDTGATLASLATKEENDFIRSLFENDKVADTSQEYWLGMYREDVSSNNLRDGWVWLDGTDFGWANWVTREPGYGDRAARLRTHKDYKWAGKELGTQYGCICEKGAMYETTTTTTTTTTATTTTRTTTPTSRKFTTKTATVTKYSTKTAANTRSPTESGSFPTTASSATDNCACDSTEREGVLIAVGVVGWCLLVIVVAIGVVIICILKRRQSELELKFSGSVSGPKHDYEQVVLPTVTAPNQEYGRPEGPFTNSLTHSKPEGNPSQHGSEKTDATDYENPPDQSVIQYENTGFGSSTSGKVRSEDEDTVKYESLRGSERSPRPNQTYTTLSPE